MHGEPTRPWPVEGGNAASIRPVCLGLLAFPMLHFAAIASFLTEEPALVHIRTRPGAERHTLTQVFRLRFVDPDGSMRSWCIYSTDCEWASDRGRPARLVLRHAAWDRARDVERARALPPGTGGPVHEDPHRQALIAEGPTMHLTTVYLGPPARRELVDAFGPIDRWLAEGISLQDRDDPETLPEWGDLEVMRAFDWGSVHTSWWSGRKASPDIEALMAALEPQLQGWLDARNRQIHQVQLDYTMPLDLYLDLLMAKRGGVADDTRPHAEAPDHA